MWRLKWCSPSVCSRSNLFSSRFFLKTHDALSPQSACFERAVSCTDPCPPESCNHVQHVQLSALPQPKMRATGHMSVPPVNTDASRICSLFMVARRKKLWWYSGMVWLQSNQLYFSSVNMLCLNDGDFPFKYIIHVLLTIASGFFNSWELNSDEGCVRFSSHFVVRFCFQTIFVAAWTHFVIPGRKKSQSPDVSKV